MVKMNPRKKKMDMGYMRGATFNLIGTIFYKEYMKF